MLILVLSRCLWSRLLHHQRMIMQSVKKICRVSLKNMISLLMLIWNIEKLERAGEVFVIRPSVPLTIPRICKSAEEIEKTYQIGVMDAKKMMADLRKWLETSEGSEG